MMLLFLVSFCFVLFCLLCLFCFVFFFFALVVFYSSFIFFGGGRGGFSSCAYDESSSKHIKLTSCLNRIHLDVSHVFVSN